MSISAAIPAYRNPEQLARCLAALEAQTRFVLPLVHDNSEHNIGFTAAVNKLLRGAIVDRQQYVIVLNQDCYLRPDAVERAAEFMDARPRCAIAGVKQLSSVDQDVIVHGGCTVAYPTGQHLGGRVSHGHCAESQLMPWVNGACLIVRSQAVINFGLLDERMFLVGSDSDWCYRARWAGWEVWYAADAVCVHEQGVSAKPPDDQTLRIMAADMRVWAAKWIGTSAYARLSRSAEVPQ